MFDKVLVGVDGRQGGRDAIALAKRLAAPGSTVTLTHVDACGPAPALDEPVLRVHGGSVAHPLRDLAVRRGCDLLVVGSCHRGALGRLFVGNDTAELLHGATCAVAVAPAGYEAEPHPLSTPGVGLDGSPESAHALAAAQALADRFGSTIRALWVLPRQSLAYGEPIPRTWADVETTLTDHDLRRLENLRDVEPEVSYGAPGEHLARFTEEVDLLSVGSRGYGALGRLLNGSSSSYLAGHARCPLLVLPRSLVAPGT